MRRLIACLCLSASLASAVNITTIAAGCTIAADLLDIRNNIHKLRVAARVSRTVVTHPLHPRRALRARQTKSTS